MAHVGGASSATESERWGDSSWLLTQFGAQVNRPPAISPSTAAALTLVYTLLYIAPFYLSPTLRSTSLANRNNPSVIKARIRAVGLTCLASTAITVVVLATQGRCTLRDLLRLFGLYPVHSVDIAKCLLLVSILFIGPLFEAAIVEGEWRAWLTWNHYKDHVYDDLRGWRNYVVGPASEELVFRSLAISLFLLAQSSPVYITFVSPLIFGLAHLHHLHECIIARQRPGTSYLQAALTPSIIIPGLVQALVMFTYTSLFGFFEAFLYLRTGNVWACIAAHSFCNAMGLPRFYGRVGKGLGKAAAEMVNGRKPVQGEDHGSMRYAPGGDEPGDLGIEWTVIYYVLLVGGALSFKYLLWPLTDSDLALASI